MSESNAHEESKSSNAIVVLFVVVLFLVLVVGYALMFKRGEKTSFDLNSGREKTAQFVWFYNYKTTEQESIFCKRVKECGLAKDEPRWVDETGRIGAKKVEYAYNGADDVAQNAEIFLGAFRLDQASEREFLSLVLEFLATPERYSLAHEAITAMLKKGSMLEKRPLTEEESQRALDDLHKEIERLQNGGLAELEEKAREFQRAVEETNRHMLEHAHDHDHAHEAEHDHEHAHEAEHDHEHAHDAEHDHDHAHDAEHDHEHAHDAEHDHDHAHDAEYVDEVPASSL